MTSPAHRTNAVVRLRPPPSANAMWRMAIRGSKRGLVLSKSYKAWLEESILLLRVGMPKAKRYPVMVRIYVAGGVGFGVNRDGDNTIKPLVDCLRKAERIVNDTVEHVNRIELQYLTPSDAKQEAYCLVELVEATQ